MDKPFVGEVAALARVLASMGYRLGRGTYVALNKTTVPTLVIDRPEVPEWRGVWRGYIDESELQTAIFLADEALTVWEENRYLYEKEVEG